MLCSAAQDASPLSGMVTMYLLMSVLPFGALAEAGLQPAKRCPPVLIPRSPKVSRKAAWFAIAPTVATMEETDARGPRRPPRDALQWGRSASAHKASTKPASAAGRSIGLAQAKGASTSAIVAPPPRPGRPRRARSPDSRGPIQWLARHRGHELDTGEPLGPRGIFTEREDQAPDAPTNKGRVCVHVRDRQHDARSRQENHHRGRDEGR
jgi:hypothetical protein